VAQLGNTTEHPKVDDIYASVDTCGRSNGDGDGDRDSSRDCVGHSARIHHH
jgi:hypothetical protein